MDSTQILTAISLLLLGGAITEYIRRTWRSEHLAHEVYVAKLNAAKEIAGAFMTFRTSQNLGTNHKEAFIDLCRVLGSNSFLFPKNVLKALLVVIDASMPENNPDLGKKMHDALNLLRSDLGFPMLEEGFFREVIKSIEPSSNQQKR